MHPAGTETARTSDSLHRLRELGQSIWLDYIRRHLITSGELRQLVDYSAVTGITANPSIFEKAILGSTDYQDALATIAKAGRATPRQRTRRSQSPTSRTQPQSCSPYDETRGRDGFVSLEVSPLLAHDTQGTIAEARRLWAAIGRKNVMIKVPGTVEGFPAIKQLTEDGINVNVTLLFSLAAYEAVAQAYLEGLEARVARGDDVEHIASVASFFVSRIDTAVDALIADRLKHASNADDRARLQGLVGQIAIANAKLAYECTNTSSRLVVGLRWPQGSSQPTAAVGKHSVPKPRIPGCAVRRGAHRPRHDRYDDTSYDRGVPRSWPCPGNARRGRHAGA